MEESEREEKENAEKSNKIKEECYCVVDDARLVDSILSLRMTHKLHDWGRAVQNKVDAVFNVHGCLRMWYSKYIRVSVQICR